MITFPAWEEKVSTMAICGRKSDFIACLKLISFLPTNSFSTSNSPIVSAYPDRSGLDGNSFRHKMTGDDGRVHLQYIVPYSYLPNPSLHHSVNISSLIIFFGHSATQPLQKYPFLIQHYPNLPPYQAYRNPTASTVPPHLLPISLAPES